MKRCRARFTDLELIQTTVQKVDWCIPVPIPRPPNSLLYLLVWENMHSNTLYVFVQAFTCTYTWKIQLQTLTHPLHSPVFNSVCARLIVILTPLLANETLPHACVKKNSNQTERSVAAELTAETTCGATRASSVCSEPPFLTPGV